MIEFRTDENTAAFEGQLIRDILGKCCITLVINEQESPYYDPQKDNNTKSVPLTNSSNECIISVKAINKDSQQPCIIGRVIIQHQYGSKVVFGSTSEAIFLHVSSGRILPSLCRPESSALAKLDAMIGMAHVKKQVLEHVSYLDISTLRGALGYRQAPVSKHLVFCGNPGTGKTSVARIVAELYKASGICRSTNIVEVGRSDLVAGFVGQTALKTREILESAKGGVLFIDEAYTLTGATNNDFGSEAVSEILAFMENNREEIVVIVAGYPDEMERFIKSDPGLQSRFKKKIHFPDHSISDLCVIFVNMCSSNDYIIDIEDDATLQLLIKCISSLENTGYSGNARLARNFFEEVLTKHALRLKHDDTPTTDSINKILPIDMKSAIASMRG